jgi:hypothetical protein
MFRISRWLTVRLSRSAFATLPGLAMTACIAAVSPACAHVHHSPDGASVNWYPMDCCHGGDCHPVSRIRTWADGLLITTEDGTTLFVNSSKVRRPSNDGRWHVCYGGAENPAILCIFEPPNS